MGWVPETEFRGPKGSFVSADEFVKRGENIMPVLRANNERLVSRLTDSERRNAELQAQLKETQEQVDALVNFNEEISKDRVAQKKVQLAARLKQAREDNDTEAEVEIQDELNALREEKPLVKKRTVKPGSSTPPEKNPEFLAFKEANPWYGTDSRRTAIAEAIGADIQRAAKAQGAPLYGKAFFDKVQEEMDKLSPNPKRSRSSRVESGARGEGAGGGGSSGGGKTVADLPPDAKAAMRRQGAKLIGPGKAFKDEAAWNAHYVKKYFE
jgi:hypothetical protein